MKITITYDGYDYRIPAPDNREASAYYTDDKLDAEDTARIVWGRLVELRFHTVTQHPET